MPSDWFGVAVVLLNVAHHSVDQLGHATESTTAQSLLVEIPKEPLNYIQPRTAGRDEMEVETFMSLEPIQDLRMFVRGVVIHNQMKTQILRRLGVNLREKLDPLLVSVTRHAGGDDFALEHVDRRKERRGTMAFVVVGHRAAAAGLEGQTRLRAIEGLI